MIPQKIAVAILRRMQKILRIPRMLTTLAQILLQPHLGKSLSVSTKALLLQAPKAPNIIAPILIATSIALGTSALVLLAYKSRRREDE